ncbi:MAG: type VII secretion protein EssC [Coriobacteriales bacterium]|jgi:S-DNA-T family DNA segregation ATPase FtsK/SpoIIIE|nr:type VII secretion protein EssC [Coriobacteriales bacterium]
MRLTLISESYISASVLPKEVSGKHWIFDKNELGQTFRLAAIEAVDGSWMISSSDTVRIFDAKGTECNDVVLVDGLLLRLKSQSGTISSLLCEYPLACDKSFVRYQLQEGSSISIGRAEDNSIVFNSEFCSAHHVLLTKSCGVISVRDMNSANGVFINGRLLPRGKTAETRVGDVICILALRILIGKGFIALNNPGGRINVCDTLALQSFLNVSVAKANEIYHERKAKPFFRSPRIMRNIDPKIFEVEMPPNRTIEDEPPAILRIGPSLGMALTSCLMGMYMLSNLIGGNGTLMQAAPMLGMVVVMIAGAILWPNLQSRYNKQKAARKEERRRFVYASYLDRVRNSILEEQELQRSILEENRISVEECISRVCSADRRIFERRGVHADFMELRVGRGDVELSADIKWPQDKLSMDEDVLKEYVLEISRQPLIIKEVPVTFSLLQDFISGIVGKRTYALDFLRGLLVQICALHSPDDVKLVVLVNESETAQFDYFRALPHVFGAMRQMRFLAAKPEDVRQVGLFLERELAQRIEMGDVELITDYGAYYIVVVADVELANSLELISRITALRKNRGFSVLTIANTLDELPKECTKIIELSPAPVINAKALLKERTLSTIYNPNDASGKRTEFVPDINLRMDAVAAFAAALPTYKTEASSSDFVLPKALGFLESFEVAKVEHLNIAQRWRQSNPSDSLAVSVGVGTDGEPFILDIHEDAHGPHGLVAGMTGSGKSEWIISYILALALNFRPDEVSFVLIDYKGGGLAGAFANEKSCLPHLAGTITNLDGTAIKRSLISIQSELRRRQDCFNHARDAAGLGTMDIYKYQELYRQGIVNEPITHLLIISDEFAELKAQEPEFMEQLISTARIGRSLGVHLILATQKPSGVVNDQIWSNARFKICLKVADASDSKEMLKRPEAAELVDAGRFYLQVGFNEHFALGQSAYAGVKYRPSQRFEKPRDNSVVLISDTARPLLTAKPDFDSSVLPDSTVPESVVVLEHIAAVAAEEGLVAPLLWQQPLPDLISLDDVYSRYLNNRIFDEPALEPVIGELDDPFNQNQRLLTLPLSVAGNTIIYGAVGSGKTALLSTIIISLLREHSARTVNLYCIDLESESMTFFRSAHQVGDILVGSDVEKIDRLFDMLNEEVEQRRNLLSNAGCGFSGYAAHCENDKNLLPLPSIVMVIHGIEMMYELYERHIDNLVRLSRDGLRFGIVFILTASKANGVPYRLLPNFSQKLILRMNSEDEYMAVLGPLHDVVIPSGFARGLVREDRLYEFQTALVTPGGLENEAIAALCDSYNKRGGHLQAKSIPVLPDFVYADSLPAVQDGLVPLGIAKANIKPVFHDFKRLPVFLALGDDEEREAAFAAGITATLRRISGAKLTVLDPDGLLNTLKVNQKTDSGLFECLSGGDAINSFVEQLGTISFNASNYLVILSLRAVVDVLGANAKAAFESFFVGAAYKKLGGLIVCGNPARFSTFSYDAWYRELTQYGTGFWLTDGVTVQLVLKVGRMLPELNEQLQEGFGWYLGRGNPQLVKLVGVGNAKNK